MTSKIIVNTIEADTGISSVTFASNINLQNDSSVLVSSSGVTLGTGSTIAAPSANEIALSTNSAERIRVDSSGRLLIGRTSALASSAERLTIDDGMAIFRRNNSNAAAVYIRNEDTTADTRQPYLIFTDGGGNRGGFGVQYNESSLWISGQNGIAFRTGGTAPSTTERLRINSAGNLGIGGLTNPGALLSIPAGESNTPRLAIESAVDDNDFTITQYEDGNGTYTMLGQNVKLNSGGNNTILDSAHRTAGILLDARNHGSIVFLTGGTNSVGENVKIDSIGRALIGSPNGSTSQLLQIKGDTGGSANGGTILLQNGVADSSAANGTGLGGIAFGGATGNQYCRIEGFADGSGGTNDYPGRLSFSTTADGASSPSERMRIDASGYVTKPNTPAFFVYKATSAWALAANDHFVFDTAELNVGGHYNTSNGRFTAPITARYVFHFFSIYTGNATGDSIEMYKNGARMYGGDVHFTNSVGGNWDTVHYSRVIQLSSGDYVHMQTRTGHTFHGNHWGGWSGYMLG